MFIIPELVTVGAVMACFVFLRSFQQRNVAQTRYLPVMPTSWLMGLAEVYWVAAIASQGFSLPLALALGTGGGIGCMIAMYLHSKIFKERADALLRPALPEVQARVGSPTSLRGGGTMPEMWNIGCKDHAELSNSDRVDAAVRPSTQVDEPTERKEDKELC
jgi:hypothetical protein